MIVDAVRALPGSVGPEGRDKAELHLLEQAAEFNPRQLKVLAGCETPATWCHVHHANPWVPDGPTNVEDGVTLCSRHHAAAHDPHFETSRQPDGRLRFTRIQT